MISTRPSVELSGQRDWTCLLSAITEDGDRFFSRFEEYVTGQLAKHFLLALYEEFQEDLIVILGWPPYFRLTAVTGRYVRDDLALVSLPIYSPELNPVEECWRQLKDALDNRCFNSLDELNAAIDGALSRNSVSDMSNYFY